MNVAIPHWQGRVSPVFDVARTVRVALLEHDRVRESRDVVLEHDGQHDRVRQLEQLGVAVLICGAISWPLERALVDAGIEVIPQTCGGVEEVLAAYAAGGLAGEAFLMPGSCGRRRRHRWRPEQPAQALDVDHEIAEK